MSDRVLMPAGEHHVYIHHLSRIGVSKAYTLHCSVIPTGERLMLKLFKFHVTDLIAATLHQSEGCEQFSGCQVIVKLELDPKTETNQVKKILKVKRLAKVESDVVSKPLVREYCEFGNL